MKKGRFENTGAVFAFTFKQSATGKAFTFLTCILPVILFAVCFLVNVIPATMSDEEEISPVEKVYLIDKTGTDLFGDAFIEMYDKDLFSNMIVYVMDDESLEDVCELISRDETRTFIILAETENDEDGVPYFVVTAVIPEWSELSEDDCMEVLDVAASCMDALKIATAQMDYESLIYLSSYVYSDVVEAGESLKTLGSYVVKSVVPMILMLVIYLMVILYGQSIGKVVIAEKSSKLMEMLLTSVQPEALIAGKIMAMTSLALMQMFLWIIGGVAGFGAGYEVAKFIDPERGNVIVDTISLVMEDGAAFSPLAIILSVLALIFGFLLYCIVAGLIASFAGKAEELAGSTGIYNSLVVLGFFGAYFPIMMENATLSFAVRIFPLTSAFALGSDILVGNAGVPEGFLELLILIVMDVILVVVTARVYKARVFYVGSTPFARIKRTEN